MVVDFCVMIEYYDYVLIIDMNENYLNEQLNTQSQIRMTLKRDGKIYNEKFAKFSISICVT